jgi:hypothetical protein
VNLGVRQETTMTVNEFLIYLIGREPTHELGLQLADAYTERRLRRAYLAAR